MCVLPCSKSQVQAMLSVDLHCEQEMLGKVYAVLSKRRAKVQGEVLREGTSIFYVHAFLYLVGTDLGRCPCRYWDIIDGMFPLLVTVSTRILHFLVGDYNLNLPTVTGRGRSQDIHCFVLECWSFLQVNSSFCRTMLLLSITILKSVR